MKFDNREDTVQMTPMWEGERFPNGRPRVPDDILRRMERLTLEGVWRSLWRNDYKYQFEGEFKTVHPNKVLVGRAVTSVLVPYRPDLHQTLLQHGREKEGRSGFFNQWIIDTLEENDVVVVDLFDKVFRGTYVGGNLSTAIASRTKQGGAIIWGGIRDLQQIQEIENIQVYYRGIDPTGIGEVTMVGMNTPCRIGKAICMPGDVVYGTPGGVLFVPPHMAEMCVVDAEKVKVRDIFGFERLKEGTYTTAQIDRRWTVAMWEDFVDWFSHHAPEEYKHLNWDEELAEAREKEGQESPEVRL